MQAPLDVCLQARLTIVAVYGWTNKVTKFKPKKYFKVFCLNLATPEQTASNFEGEITKSSQSLQSMA